MNCRFEMSVSFNFLFVFESSFDAFSSLLRADFRTYLDVQ